MDDIKGDKTYMAASDLQFLQQGFITINGVPTHIMTCGRWLNEPLPENDSEKLLILFIPGNPGGVEYYEEFMSSLYEGLQRAVPIWGVSHAGHVHPPSEQHLPKLQGNEHLYNVEGQIQHKVDFINTYVPKDRQLVIIGHSIGCYILLEILKRIPQLKVVHGFLLFPTIERMATTPQAHWVWPVLTYFRLPALLTVYALSYLTPQLQWRLLAWYFRDRSVPDCVIRASLHLFQPDCARLCMFMGKDELETVTALDVDNIRNNLSRLTFYYGASDQWCPLSYYRDLKEAFPEGDVRLCRNKFDHAFVLDNSREVGALVSVWILEDILGTSKEIHAKSLFV